jgi:hypothetical protein
VKHHIATVMGVVSIPMHPLKFDVSKTVRSAPVIYMVKQLLHLSRTEYIERHNGCATMDTCILTHQYF